MQELELEGFQTLATLMPLTDSLPTTKRMKHEDYLNLSRKLIDETKNFNSHRCDLLNTDLLHVILEILHGNHIDVLFPILSMHSLSLRKTFNIEEIRKWGYLLNHIIYNRSEEFDRLGIACIRGLANFGNIDLNEQPTKQVSGNAILDYISNNEKCTSKEEFEMVFSKMVETYRVYPPKLIKSASEKGFFDGFTLTKIKELFGPRYESNPFYWDTIVYEKEISFEDTLGRFYKSSRGWGVSEMRVNIALETLVTNESKKKFWAEAMKLKPFNVAHYLDIYNERKFIKNLLLMARHYSVSCGFHNLPLEIFSFILEISEIYPPLPFF